MDILIYYYKTYPVVTYSTIVLVLVSLCAALLGVSLVLKRFSMIGDGLSHVAFGATAVAAAVSQTPMYVALPFTVFASIFLLRMRSSAKVTGEAAIAMISAGSLAFGYMVMNLFPSVAAGSSGDPCTSLFGSDSIIGIKKSDVALCAVLAVFVLFIFIFFYNKIFAVTFDESFSSATGIKTELYNTMLASVTGVIIVIAMNMVGALLISALITFPALSSMRIFKSFKRVMICSACISCGCALIGTLICILASTPVGPTIAITNIAVFGICYVIGIMMHR